MVHSFIDCPRQITFLKKDHKTMIFVLWSQSQWSHHIKEKMKSFHELQRRRPHFTGTELNMEVNSTPEKQINSYTFYKYYCEVESQCCSRQNIVIFIECLTLKPLKSRLPPAITLLAGTLLRLSSGVTGCLTNKPVGSLLFGLLGILIRSTI